VGLKLAWLGDLWNNQFSSSQMRNKFVIILILFLLIIIFALPIPQYRGQVHCKIGGKCPPSNSWYLTKPIGWQLSEWLYCQLTQCQKVEAEPA